MKNENSVTRKQIQAGRQAAVAVLCSDLCIDGGGLASLLGMSKWFDSVFYIRAVVGFLCLLWFFRILKNDLKNSELWISVLKEDRVTLLLWVFSVIVIGTSMILSR